MFKTFIHFSSKLRKFGPFPCAIFPTIFVKIWFFSGLECCSLNHCQYYMETTPFCGLVTVIYVPISMSTSSRSHWHARGKNYFFDLKPDLTFNKRIESLQDRFLPAIQIATHQNKNHKGGSLDHAERSSKGIFLLGIVNQTKKGRLWVIHV